jgi:hypothetical protein
MIIAEIRGDSKDRDAVMPRQPANPPPSAWIVGDELLVPREGR